jgi:NAD(P)-dependent dehydrogenase (short-subunit alcohol dehydrogenase family)
MTESERHRAFVTGGTGSVGQAIVKRLANGSKEVVFQYSSQDEAANALKHETGAEAWKCEFNQHLKLPSGEFGIVVNSAGVLLTKTDVEGISDEEWQQTMHVNAYVPFAIAREYVPGMKKRSWGRIVNIGSIYSLRGSTRNGAYNMSKHALSGLTRSLAKEVGPFGITANEVCPAAVTSRTMDRVAQDNVDAGNAESTDSFLSSVAAAIPAGRMARPEDIASMVEYLVSDEAGFLNGVSIPVDGGLIA